MFRCCLQVCLAGKTISCQTEKGNRVKHRQILQGKILCGGRQKKDMRNRALKAHGELKNRSSCDGINFKKIEIYYLSNA